MPHSANKRTKRRCRYSKCISKRGRTVKRNLYSYYSRHTKTGRGKGKKKKGG